ncbi:MAG: xylulokinase [Spirochaetota bacterium]|nr:MAG: xylulokinase [Spirochaetota bacterium]
MYMIGIDVGTTGLKAILTSPEGKIVADATESYPLYTPQTNWFEQNPEDWWQAAVTSINKILDNSDVKSEEIAGVGLSGQYHGAVLIDKNSHVIRPCIMWNDQRTEKQSNDIVQSVGKEKLMKIASTSGAPYFTACKLLWVRDNEPDNYERVFKLLLPKDYIRLRLTGEYATEVTDASGTLFLDINKRKWSSEMARLLDVDASILPNLYESQEVTGKISKIAAEQTGLKSGTPVAGGGGDQACAAVGNGIVEEGLVSYSIGTSGVIYAATKHSKTEQLGRLNIFCHAVPGQWCLLACVNSAAGSLQWFVDNFAESEKLEAANKKMSVFEILEQNASKIPPGSDRLFFLPYLAGERHPHTDPYAKGVFFGLHSGHGKTHAVRAILEGVAFSFRDCLEVIEEKGLAIREIRATGGGAKSRLWLQIQVNTSDQPIVTMRSDQGGAAFGAAILASVGTGVYGDLKEACEQLVMPGEVLKPDPEMADKYNGYFNFYRSLYPLLKERYRALAEL